MYVHMTENEKEIMNYHVDSMSVLSRIPNYRVSGRISKESCEFWLLLACTTQSTSTLQAGKLVT